MQAVATPHLNSKSYAVGVFANKGRKGSASAPEDLFRTPANRCAPWKLNAEICAGRVRSAAVLRLTRAVSEFSASGEADSLKPERLPRSSELMQ